MLGKKVLKHWNLCFERANILQMYICTHIADCSFRTEFALNLLLTYCLLSAEVQSSHIIYLVKWDWQSALLFFFCFFFQTVCFRLSDQSCETTLPEITWLASFYLNENLRDYIFNKQHSDLGVVIFKVCEDWGEGSGDGILCVSVGFGEGPSWLGWCFWCAGELVSQSTSSEWRMECHTVVVI